MTILRPKGTRDYAFEDALLRQQVVDRIRHVLELYGFNALETPTLERFETLSTKHAGGNEILKETFKLKDQGGRLLGLRYDLTVPLARFMAMNPQLKLPFKRYQLGRVFRDGPVKLGRYREFSQLDFDIVGAVKPWHEVEIVQVLISVFEDLKLDVEIRVNDRLLLNNIIRSIGVDDKDLEPVIIALDKLDKLSVDEVKKELFRVIDKQKALKLLDIVLFDGSNTEKIAALKRFLNVESLGDIEDFLRASKDLGIKNIVFTASLARGLSYYTGIVFEVFLKDQSIKSSLAAGGRYDNMIGSYIRDNEKNEKSNRKANERQIPAVGASFGLDVIVDALKLKGFKTKKSVVQALVVGVGIDMIRILEIANNLRSMGLRVDVGFKKGLSKNLEVANYYNIPFVVIIGKRELKKGLLKLKDMGTGKEKLLDLKNIKKEISSKEVYLI